MLEALVRGDWIAETLANIANTANEAGAEGVDPPDALAQLEPPCAESRNDHRINLDDWEIPHQPSHQTNKVLLFNDPNQQQTMEIPAQTPCLLVCSVELAKLYGLLTDPVEEHFAKVAVGKGFKLVWLKGLLRQLSQRDIEPLPTPRDN